MIWLLCKTQEKFWEPEGCVCRKTIVSAPPFAPIPTPRWKFHKLIAHLQDSTTSSSIRWFGCKSSETQVFLTLFFNPNLSSWMKMKILKPYCTSIGHHQPSSKRPMGRRISVTCDNFHRGPEMLTHITIFIIIKRLRLFCLFRSVLFR